MKLAAVVEKLRDLAPWKDREPLVVVPADSPLLLGMVPQTDVVAIETANARKPIQKQSYLVQSVIVAAGPRVDETVNVGPIYIGSEGVSAASGFQLSPGGILHLGPIDLAKLYIVGANVPDAVRLFFLA